MLGDPCFKFENKLVLMNDLILFNRWKKLLFENNYMCESCAENGHVMVHLHDPFMFDDSTHFKNAETFCLHSNYVSDEIKKLIIIWK